MENNIDKIISLFTILLNKTKGDIVPILNKEAWDSWSEFISNSNKLTDVYAEFGKFLFTARELIIGADGTFSQDDEDNLIKEVSEIINAKINVPVLPEFVERKVFEFLLNSAYKLAKEKFKNSPQLMSVYNALAKELDKG
jgi:hypothetical protein